MMNRISAAFAALGLASLISTAATAQPSVSFQINPAHTGSTVFPDGFKTPLEIAWSRKWPIHGGGQINSVAYPLIVDGKVFVAVTPFGRPNNTGPLIEALSLQDGRVLWSKTLASNFQYFAGLTYDNGRLFVVTGRGIVYALNPETGQVIWHKSIRDGNSWVFHSAPTAARGRVFVKGSGSEGTLFALDQSTGKIDWKQRLRGIAFGTPTVAGSSVFVTHGGHVYNFHDATGRLRWLYRGSAESGIGETGPVYAGHLYANNAAAIYEMNSIKSGQPVNAFRNVWKLPAFYNGIGYFVTYGDLVAWSTETEEVLWRQFEGPLALPPLVVNGNVIGVDHVATVYVLDGTSGQILQQLPLPSHVTPNSEYSGGMVHGMAAGEGFVIVPANDMLFALKPASD
jgi:outer membrane protein assembly factor BamB